MATFFNTEDFDLDQEAEEMAFNERYRIARRRMIVHQLRKQKKGEEEEEKKRGLRSAVIFPPSGPIPFVMVEVNKEEEEAKIIATPEHFPSGPIPFVKKITEEEEEEKPEIIVIPEQFRKCLFSEPKYGNRSETYQQLMIHRDWVTFMDNHLCTITGKTKFYRDWLQEIGEEAKKRGKSYGRNTQSL